MSELVAVVFDDPLAAGDFEARVRELDLHAGLRIEGLTVVRRRLDDRLTVRRQLPSRLDTFWGLLVGLVLWPHWLGMTEAMPASAAATLDTWGLTPGWADAVAKNVAPGNVAVLFLASDLSEALLSAVRSAEGDLFHMRLTEPMKVRLTEAFGGLGQMVEGPQGEVHPG